MLVIFCFSQFTILQDLSCEPKGVGIRNKHYLHIEACLPLHHSLQYQAVRYHRFTHVIVSVISKGSDKLADATAAKAAFKTRKPLLKSLICVVIFLYFSS